MLANHLMESTLCVGVAWLLTLALKNNRAAVRYGIWLAASVKFLVPFSLLMSVGSHFAWRTTLALSIVMEEIGRPFAMPVAMPATVAAAPSGPDRLPMVLFGLWLCGFVAGIVSWVRWWRQIRTAQRASTPLDFNLPIPVRSSHGRIEPGVFGILRPVLLLPEGITDRLTASQLKSIIAHELCHVRRRDNLTGAIHVLVETIFWFHPLVWWIRARLIEERERACDEEVLRMGGDADTYAEGILNVCRFYLEAPLCVSGITGSDLKKRIERIKARSTVRKLGPGRKLLLTAAGVLSLAWPIAAGLLNAPVLRAQEPPATATISFEVASIKPSAYPGGNLKAIQLEPGRLTIKGMSLKDLMQRAYGRGYALQISRSELVAGGEKWCDSDLYDIEAKPGGDPEGSGEQVSLMLRRLLADRFRLRLHHEVRESSGYLLVVGKDGLKMKTRRPGDGGEARLRGRTRRGLQGEVHVAWRDFSLSALADYMGIILDRPVADRTGVGGAFDFDLSWLPDETQFGGRLGAPGGSDMPGLFTAMREQIGLRLEAGKVPIDVMVIDHAEKPSAN